MAPSRSRKRRENVKKREQMGAKSKSKYFNKAHNIAAKPTAKSISKQTRLATDKGEKNASISGALSVPIEPIAGTDPQVFGKRLTGDFFDAPTETLAVALLGTVLCRKTAKNETICGKIVETEAYLGEIDPACHAYGGKRTSRNAPMYGPPGTAYVYFIYGMYHCFNISSKESGACVLIRALEPLTGLADMRRFRNARRKETSKPLKDHELANGPSKLCSALDITKDKLNNTNMAVSDLFWLEDINLKASKEFSVVQTTRIGIDSYGEEAARKLFRYYILGNKHVSIKDKHAEKKLAGTCD